MKYVVTKKELCDGCGICEEVCSKSFFKEKNKRKSAIRINDKGLSQFDINVCTQDGECIEICPTGAIVRKKHTIIINKEDCVGCFSCVGFCPNNAMRYHEEINRPFKCVSCGLCIKECPTGAINLEEQDL